MSNKALWNSKNNKNDEFYTRYEDIECELSLYEDYFNNKTIYLNCDDYASSNFFKYFANNTNKIKFKKVICSGLNKKCVVINNDSTIEIFDIDSGDFRSKECIGLLISADIIITNPPFSLFREYISILLEYNKKFLIVGTYNAITYSDFFPHIKNKDIFLSSANIRYFLSPDGEEKCISHACWYTNIKESEKPFLQLKKSYSDDKYDKYDNYNAINIDKVSDIPYDYYDVMGVPITFITKWNSKQFCVLGLTKKSMQDGIIVQGSKTDKPSINGKILYMRVLIRRIL